MERVWAIITTVFFSFSRLAMARFTASSFSISRDAVASSKSRMGLFFRIARAIEIRWRSPPERRFPFSPVGVSYPFSILRMKPSQLASRQAASISSSVASGRACRIFSRMVSSKRNTSWSTIEICSSTRSAAIWFIGLPPMEIVPPVAS